MTELAGSASVDIIGAVRRSPPRPTTPTLTSALAASLHEVHLPPALLSPVNQRGHFEFDRVIKSGSVLKRTRKTKSWRPVHLVLRPLELSIYRNADETKLRHKINLSELTVVARQRDPKGKAQHVFGLFSPSKNYHLAGGDDGEAQDWVESIRREARMGEDEKDIQFGSEEQPNSQYIGFSRAVSHATQTVPSDTAGLSSSDAELASMSPMPKTRARKPSTVLEYSGAENASASDFSDTGPHVRRVSVLSNPGHGPSASLVQAESKNLEEEEARASVAELQAAARIICQGWILLLKSRSGVKAWRKTWMVLRARSLAMYKNEKEYRAIRVIPSTDIVDAVEIDPISSSKLFCMQVITDERGYRFCASDGDDLAKWLASFKRLLADRKEHRSGTV